MVEPYLSTRLGRELLLEHSELERKRNQTLLRAVMKVALEALPFLLAGVDHSCARGLELLQARLQLGVEAPILEGHTGSCRNRREQVWLSCQSGVVQ